MERANEIIGLIPDVKPRVAMRVLREAVIEGAHGLGALSEEDRALALREGWVMRISPIGGRILLSLFEAGKIPQKSSKASCDVSELRSYAAGEGAYRDAVRAQAAREADYARRVREIADDPACARPDEVSADLIDRVFLERFGYGHFGELEIGGLRCHKAITSPQVSNSGKNRTPGEVYCYWCDETGERRGKVPVEGPRNRRNDPARNWGLGRE